MSGAVASLALGLAREADRSAPGWAGACLDACEPDSVVAQIRRHRISDVALPILSEDARFEAGAIALVADSRRTRLQSMSLVAGLRRATQALESAAVRHLVVKGPALAAQTTGDWAARRSVDIDLLIDLRDLPAVAQALEGAGFPPRRGFAPDPKSPLFSPTARWLQELAFGSQGHSIDVHWRLDPSRGCLTWDFQDLWNRRAYVEVGGAAVATLAPPDAALFNAVHAGKDCWASLHQIRDHVRIKRVAKLSADQWQLAAREASCQVRWAVAEEICRPLLATQPAKEQGMDGHDRRTRLLARRLWLWLASGQSPTSSGSPTSQARYLSANVAGYDTPRAAMQRLGVLVWPMQEMSAESLGSWGNRHPWLYPATAPLHIPRRIASKARLATTSRTQPQG